MSRQIKFRVWDDLNKEMVFDTNLFFLKLDGTIHFWSGDECLINGKIWPPHLILEQFTGLLDSEGKEIYEGDIVSVIYPEYQAAKVFYCSHSASFRLLSKNVALPMITMRTVEGQNAKLIPIFNEVLGNIHENPELLAA